MVRRTCTSLLFVSLLSAPALACADDEATLFACGTQDQSHAILICAVRDDAAGGYQSVRYSYGTEAVIELSYPDDRRRGRETMFFAHSIGRGGYNWSLRFENGGYRYRVFFEQRREDSNPETIAAAVSGVEVWRKKKKIATVMCDGQPYAAADDIRRATSCDLSNPFGAEGCSATPPIAR